LVLIRFSRPLDGKLDRAVMEERRSELLRIQEAVSLAKSRDMIGRTVEVLVEGLSEETEFLLEARHEGMAPEIDGVVYLNDDERSLTHPPQARRDAPLPVPGDFVKTEITDAGTYDLVGHIIG
jgi:ribosomal protein S12 methylthiotransferase